MTLLSNYDIPNTFIKLDVVAVVCVISATYLARWIWQYSNVLLQVRGLPTIHSWMEFFESGARSQLPHIPFIVPVKKYTLDKPFEKYETYGSDLIAMTQVTTPHAVYVTSSPTAAKEILHDTSVYHKPIESFGYQAINIFGLQIVSAQTGPEHRRHKGVVRGCFGESIMENGWNKLVHALDIMLTEEKLTEGGIMKDVRTVIIKTTLLVIGQAGFGIEIPWGIPHTDGPILPFPEALAIVEASLMPQLLLPLWFMTYSPFPYLRRCAKAQRSLIHHIKQMLASRRSKLEEESNAIPADSEAKVRAPTDIIGALVASQMAVEDEEKLNKGEKGRIVGLTPQEIIGNVWIFIVAGHETTAHALTFTLGYLALYPQVQEDILAEVLEVCGDQMPAYRDFSQLPLTLATCYEALRLCDIAMTIPRLAVQDTILNYTTWNEKGEITHHSRPIKAGSRVIVDSPASQRNPFFWNDASTFNPSRHLGERGAEKGTCYAGFSMGPRQCIGKRFADVEMVALLSHLIKRFKMEPVPVRDGETWEEMRSRYTKGTEKLTLTPGNHDIRLVKRV